MLIALLTPLLSAAKPRSPALESPSSNSGHSQIQYSRMVNGQYVVEVYINAQGPFQFMLDTAASRSSLLTKTAFALGLNDTSEESRLVNGMVMSKSRPLITIDTLQFAHVTKSKHEMIILNNWSMQDSFVDGILGMDVLEHLTLQFRHKDQMLQVGHGQGLEAKTYRKWSKVKLIPNPYMEGRYGFKFMKSKIGGKRIPAILDLGSSFSALNWTAIRNATLIKEKARLREDWKIKGALGSFSPKIKIRLAELVFGDIYLQNYDFIVMDFDHLPLNNYDQYPLLIAGADLLANRDFALDFINDRLYINAPRKNRKQAPTDWYNQHSYFRKRPLP